MKLTIKNSQRSYAFNPHCVDFSIRHFRSEEQHKSGKGGYTVMAVNGPTTPYVVVSRCSDKESFSRSLGVEVCLKKYLHRNDFISDYCYIKPDSKYPFGDALITEVVDGVKSFQILAIPHDNNKNL